jgi:small subunit ribosomal protein S20
MPNTKSASKALRQARRRRVRNVRKQKSLKEALKAFERMVAAKNKTEAARLFPSVQKALDKYAKSNLISKNTAARRKSRLAARIKKLG